MRRHQQSTHRAAPTRLDCSALDNFAHQRRPLRPSLFLQLALLALLAAFFPGAKLHAQTGSITGTVVDPSGAAIPGAKIQVTDQATGNLTRETASDTGGTFRALNLPPGTYRIKISAPGMEELARDGVVLDQDQTLGLGQVALTVGQASQTVTVTTQTPLIDTATSSNAAVVDQRQVTEQPLNGRDFESLLTTLPGVVTNNNSQFRLVFNQTDDFYVNGMRGTANNFFLDGIINTDVGANDGEYTALSLDAVGEFKTLTGNFNAEYGRSPGVMILIDTKSGGEHFHGTAYEFNRNTDYNANDWFSNHNGQARADLKFNQFGGNIGGFIPIPKFSPRDNKKAFFFFNYEGTRANRPNGNWEAPPALTTPCRCPQCSVSAPPMDRRIYPRSTVRATCAITTAAQPASRFTTPAATWYRTGRYPYPVLSPMTRLARCSRVHPTWETSFLLRSSKPVCCDDNTLRPATGAPLTTPFIPTGTTTNNRSTSRTRIPSPKINT